MELNAGDIRCRVSKNQDGAMTTTMQKRRFYKIEYNNMPTSLIPCI